MRKTNKLFIPLFLLLAIVTGCQEEMLPEPEVNSAGEPIAKEAPELTQNVNQFIEDVMTDIYLWYDKVPDIDIRYEFDSKDYFNELLYEDDKWSFITDDVGALEKSFSGVETSFGYSLAFGRFSNSDNIFAVIEYVYPGTPAAEAGLKRGDFLIELNSSDITDENYTDLLYGETITLTKGVWDEGGISDGNTVTITSAELRLDPVLKTEVIEHEGHKIGYLMYAQFISDYNASLDAALQSLKDEQITDLVIDLRYNPGGTTDAAQHLCSSVAPASVVESESPLVTYQWNNNYQQYWQSSHDEMQLGVDFESRVPVKLGLDNIYFLTGTGTASASEFTITGLQPYMDVTTVGETTHGKYTASITMKPEYFYEDESYINEISNWGIQPIVLRYANSQGVTDFKDGFAPDIPVEDDLMAGFPLGDKNEPLLKAAIEDITGTEIVAQKSAKKGNIPEFQIFDRGFSKFDKNKRELVIDNVSAEELMR